MIFALVAWTPVHSSCESYVMLTQVVWLSRKFFHSHKSCVTSTQVLWFVCKLCDFHASSLIPTKVVTSTQVHSMWIQKIRVLGRQYCCSGLFLSLDKGVTPSPASVHTHPPLSLACTISERGDHATHSPPHPYPVRCSYKFSRGNIFRFSWSDNLLLFKIMGSPRIRYPSILFLGF